MGVISPEQMLKATEEYLEKVSEALAMSVKVGLPEEKVSGKAYESGISVARLGAVHEYGAVIDHPGGTSYKIGKDGKAKFVKSGTDGIVGKTSSHKINIPSRSFLRKPFDIKKKVLSKTINKQFDLVRSSNTSAKKGLGIIGEQARNIVLDAFNTEGFGTWEPSKKDGQTLVDTGVLRGSISYVVENNK